MTLDFKMWYTLSLLIIMSILLILDIIELEVLFFSILLLLLMGKIITLEEAFAGFSNVGMLTIALLFVIAGALSNTGMLKQISPIILGKENTSISRTLLRLLFPVSIISAFINNTPVVAMFIPTIRSWTEKHHYSPCKYLIP